MRRAGQRWCRPAGRASPWSRRPARESAAPTCKAHFLASSISLYSWGVRAGLRAAKGRFDARLGGAFEVPLGPALSGPAEPGGNTEVSAARRERGLLGEAFHDAASPGARARLGEDRQQQWERLHARRCTRARASPFRKISLAPCSGSCFPVKRALYYWLEADSLLIASVWTTPASCQCFVASTPSDRAGLERRFAQYVLQFSDQSSQLRLDDVTDFSELLLPQRSARSCEKRGGCVALPIVCCTSFLFMRLCARPTPDRIDDDTVCP